MTPSPTPATRWPRSASEVSGRPDRESGTGLISSAAGVVVFLMFLMPAVQLLFGLYATSHVNAIAYDAVQRDAGGGAPSLEEIEADARNSTGRIGKADEVVRTGKR